jgi:carbonic anhydrase
MRSLALACAVKDGREIVIIGHTDCQVARTTTMVLLDKLTALGVDRSRLPENINEFFGTFGSERQNVIKGCDYVRHSPLIGPKIPVHGMLIDVATGKLDWVVNGYETLTAPGQKPMVNSSMPTMSDLGSFANFAMGEMKFPDMKIGDAALSALRPAEARLETPPMEAETDPGSPPPLPPPLPKATLPPVRMKTAPPPISPNRPYPGFKLK